MSNMNDCDHLLRLSDEQMRTYLTDGFVVLKSRLPKEVHDHIRDRCEEIFSTTGNPGNEILEMNPALRLVFSDPVVKGALSSILGDGYFMHPHRHCHQKQIGHLGSTQPQRLLRRGCQCPSPSFPVGHGDVLPAECHRRHGAHRSNAG